MIGRRARSATVRETPVTGQLVSLAGAYHSIARRALNNLPVGRAGKLLIRLMNGAHGLIEFSCLVLRRSTPYRG